MAEVDIAPHFGAELKDGFKPVHSWVTNGISWLDDIQSFYRERSVIEKEYSAKLTALAKKYFEKKARKSTSLSVGDMPSQTPGSLESASMTTWTTQLTTLESRAAEHDRFANELLANLADPLRNLGQRYEDLRKSHADYAAKLEKQRDGAYSDLKKVKGKYDDVCQEVENRRKKIESAFDSSKSKAQNAYQQQIMDMNNVKNTYLISINVTNKQKERYYHEYVPDLLDSLQDLNETRVAKLNTIWSLAAQLETNTMKRSTDQLNYLSQEIPRNDPKLDSMMFLRHNITNWQEPPDKGFEPSPVWHDDDHMVVDDNAKVFLRNVLSRSKGTLGELKREVDGKRREVEAAHRIRQNIREGKDKRDELDVVRAIFSLQEVLHEADKKRLTAEVETNTIIHAVGDVTLGASTHNFKSETFKIPTNCDLCGDRIWGLSAKGFICRDCGYTCHSKCEMKVPAECPGELSKEERKKLKTERQESARAAFVTSNGTTSQDGVSELPALSRSNTMNSLSSGYATSAHRSVSGAGLKTSTESIPDRTASSASKSAAKKHRIVAPPPSQYASELPGSDVDPFSNSKSSEQRGKMLYAYQANGDEEINVQEGKEIVVIEPDDGSGWVRVRAGSREGLVPASYVDLTPPTSSDTRPGSTYSGSSTSLASSATPAKKKGPAVAPRRGGKKIHYVEAMYDYDARSDAEWNMKEGDRFVLVNRDAGDGWADVEKGGQVKSVPANYIQDVS